MAAVITALSTAINETIIRSDQQGAAPVYPYGTWKLLSNKEEAAHSNIIARLSTGVLKTYSANKSVISLNFIDANRTDRILTLAQNALDWFKSVAGREAAQDNEIAVQILSLSIEDRTAYLDTVFENKYGFDVRFDYSGLYSETVGVVDELTIEQERDGVDQPDITYP